MSIIQDGFGLPIFSLSLYQYFVCGDMLSINVADDQIPDPGLRELVSLVSLHACVSYSYSANCGLFSCRFELLMVTIHCLIFSRMRTWQATLMKLGIERQLLENRNEIVQVMATHHTLVKAQIDQFLDGLRCLLIDEEIKRHPDMTQPLFVQQANKKLCAGKCRHVNCVLRLFSTASN